MNAEQRWLERLDAVVDEGPFSADWESLKGFKIPHWYQNAKLGIFIHWGVFCVPAFANEWYPRNMYRQGTPEFEHHVKTYGPHNQFGYKDFIPKFQPGKWKPKAWAKLFKEAGAKYVVPVAEHHDGFAMYNCALSRWNATKMGPKRDVIGELSKAVREEGLICGLSSHRAEHWWFFDGGMQFDSDVRGGKYAGLYGPAQPRIEGHGIEERSIGSPDPEYVKNWAARTAEVIYKYRPNVVYFDWWVRHLAFEPYLQKIAAFYYNLGAKWKTDVAIDGKVDAFPAGTCLRDIERGQLSEISPELWQNDTSISRSSWCDVKNNDYKTATSIIHDLLDVVSKNGTLLLNVGPKADGTIAPKEEQILREIGKFLSRVGEGFYTSRPWKKFGEGPTAVVEGAFSDTKRAAFTHQDMRFLSVGDDVYVFVLGEPPKGEVTIRSLGRAAGLLDGRVGAVTLLGGPKLQFDQKNAALHVQLPKSFKFKHAIGLKVERHS